MADNVEMTLRPIEVTPDNKPTIDFSKLDDAQLSIAEKIVSEAQAQGVDPEYALSIAHIENKFNHNTSPAGALGVMQLMPNTAKELGVDPLDVDQNIKGGITYLKQQLDHYKDPYVAGMAYNAGPGVADKFLETQDPSVVPTETLNYIDNLSNLYKPKGQDETADMPDLVTMPPTPPTEEDNSLRNKAIAGATTGTIAGLANANTRQKMIEAEAEQSTPRQRAAAKLRSENADIALKEKSKAATGRLTNQQSLVLDAEKKMASWDKAFTKAQDRLTAAEELARKLGIVEENVQTSPGGVTQKGGLGSGAMKHSNVMGEVHEANVVRKGTEATGSGWQQKSRLIVPEKYAATSSLSTEQLLAQKNLEKAQRDYRQAQIDLSKAKSAHAKESGKLANLSKQTEQGLSKAEENLNIAKEQYKNVASKKVPGMIARAGQQVGKSIFGSVIPGAAAGVDLEDARQRYNRGDIPGAVISGIGGVGGALSMVPPIPPIGTAARLIGGLTSIVAPMVNYYRDSTATEDEQATANAPKYETGGAVKKFAGGGVAKGLTKLSEELGKHEGKTVMITQADRTKVGGGYLGGPGFSGLQHVNPEYGDVGAVWAVKSPHVASTIINSAGRTPKGQTIVIPMIGTPTQHKSNQMVFDAIIKDFRNSANQGNLDPELLDKINLRLINTVDKEGKPLFSQDFDITSRKFNKAINTFDKRAAVADVIGGIGVGGKKGQIIDYDKLIRRTTDPDLIGSPTGSLGSRMFTVSGETLERPDLHPSFPTILTGEDLGVHFKPAPREIVLNDFIKSFTEAKGREPGYYDLTRGYAPSNTITEGMLTNLQKSGHAEGGLIRGYDKGGDVDAAEYYGHRLDASNSDMSAEPVISDKSGVVRMAAQKNALVDKYLGGAGRSISKGLSTARQFLNDEIPTYTKQGNRFGDWVIGEMPEAIYDYTTAGMPGPVLGNEWVHNPVTGGMMHTDPYGDIRALDFLNLAGIEVPITAGAKGAYRIAKPLARSATEHAVSGINRANRAMRTADPLLMNVETSTANRSDDVAETLRRFKEASGSSKDYPVGQGVWTGEEGAAQFHPNVMANIEDFSPEQVDHMRRMLDQYGIGAGRFRPDLISQPGHANAIQVLDADPEWIKNIGQHYAQSDLPAVVFAQPNNRAMVFNMNSDLPKDLSALLDAPQLKGKKVRYGEANIPTDRNYIDSVESARVTGTKKAPKKKAK